MRHLGWRHRLLESLWQLAIHALVLLLLFKAAGLFWVAAVPWVMWLGLAWLALNAVLLAARRFRTVAAADQRWALQDRLLTYVGLKDASPAMAAWLEQDLQGRLQTLPAAEQRRFWLPPLRKLGMALGLIVLVWFLLPLAPVQKPPQPSTAGASPQESAQAPQPQPSQTESQPQPQPQPEPQPEPQAEPNPEPPPAAGEQQEQPLDESPDPDNPSPDLPVQDEFLVPRFIQDGPSRQTLVPVAPIPSAPALRQPVPDPLSKSDTPEFKAALERALRSQHLSPAERAFVRRYFQALAKAGR